MECDQRNKDACSDTTYDTIPCQQAFNSNGFRNTFPRPKPSVPSKPVRRSSQTALPPIPSSSSSSPSPSFTPSRQLRTRCSNSEGDLLAKGNADLPTTKPRSATCADPVDSAHSQSDQKFTRSLSLSHHSSDNLLEEQPEEEEKEPKQEPPTDVSLKQFVAKCGRHLPKRARVCKGYHSMCDQATITTGDVFTFHFIRCRSVVRAQDQNGTNYTIPLNSTAQFGIVFNPSNNLEQACKGYQYESVADMLALRQLPTFVRAKFSYNTTDGPEYCVLPGEVLHLIGPTRQRNRLFLQAHSMSRNCKKLLADDCASCFSTAPEDVQLHLYEMSTTCKLESLLPIHAIVYVSERCPVPALGDLAKEVLQLRECATEVSVIATGDEGDVGGGGGGGGDSQVIEMLDSLDIELQEMDSKVEEEETLVRKARQLYEEFNPQAIKYYMNKPPSSRVFETQTALYQCVTLETHFRGLELVRSPKLSEVLSSSPHSVELELQLAKDGCFKVGPSSGHDADPSAQAIFTYAVPNPSVYAIPTCNKTPAEVMAALGRRLECLEDSHKQHMSQVMQDLSRISNEVARMSERVRQLDEVNERTKALCGRLREQVTKATNEGVSFTRPGTRQQRSLSPDGSKLDKLSSDDGYDVIIHKVGNGSGHLQGFQGLQSGHPGDRSDGYELMVPKSAVVPKASKAPPNSQEAIQNREELARLDPNEVIKLLDNMGLNQYTSTFSTEQISGDILSECSEQMLQDELKVTSKLHRMRLLKVISGSQNILALLGGNGYL